MIKKYYLAFLMIFPAGGFTGKTIIYLAERMVKDTNVFTTGRSNFGLLMSDSEAEAGSASEGEQVLAVEETEQVEKSKKNTGTESEATQVEENEEWGTAAPKKQRHPTTPGAGAAAARREHYPNKTVFIGNGTKKLPATSTVLQQSHVPVTLEDIKSETALELHSFPAKYRTSHLRKFVESVAHGEGAGYRLKWQNDSSCWVVFDSPDVLKKALVELHDEVIQVRPFAAENLVITAADHATEAKPE